MVCPENVVGFGLVVGAAVEVVDVVKRERSLSRNATVIGMPHMITGPVTVVKIVVVPSRLEAMLPVASAKTVVTPIGKHQGERNEKTKNGKRKTNSMAFDKARSISLRIDIAADESAAIANGEEESHRCCTDVVRADVAANPCDCENWCAIIPLLSPVFIFVLFMFVQVCIVSILAVL